MSEKADIWMPLNIGDYLRDTMELSAEEHGAYLLLIMAYWTRRGPLPDDDKALRSITKISTHRWRKISPKMRAFFCVKDGFWHHKRIEQELQQAAENRAKRRAQTEAAREAKAAKTRSAADSVTETPPPPPPHKESSLRSDSVESASREIDQMQPDPRAINGFNLQQAVEMWNALARELDLPLCAKLSKTRAGKLRARLQDAGGLGGWQKALEKIRGDPFFTGDNPRGWRANIDFLLREDRFAKLMEGGYDKRKPAGRTLDLDRIERLAGNVDSGPAPGGNLRTVSDG